MINNINSASTGTTASGSQWIWILLLMMMLMGDGGLCSGTGDLGLGNLFGGSQMGSMLPIIILLLVFSGGLGL